MPRAVAHAEAYAHVTSGRLVAACDTDTRRLAVYGDRFRIPERFTDLRQMLETARPDLLHIVMSPERDTVVAEAVRTAPRAILLEKPLACRPSVAVMNVSPIEKKNNQENYRCGRAKLGRARSSAGCCCDRRFATIHLPGALPRTWEENLGEM